METENWLQNVPASLDDEQFTNVISGNKFRLQKIISTGQRSADDFWYDQDEHEWVMVLSGEAKIEFAGEQQLTHLKPGDSLNIPAGLRHRVAWTCEQHPTVWLAIFYRE